MQKNRKDLILQYKLAKELHRREAQKSLSKFITYVKDDYDLQWFHELICDKIDALLDGSLGKKKLMIFVPPQSGKSTISSRYFPAYAIGKDNTKKVAMCSYNQTLASSFCVDSQSIIDSPSFKEVYGEIIGGNDKKTQDFFKVNKSSGYYKSIGVGGGLTGFTVDIGIVDDPFKDREDARSQTIRDKIWRWYDDVFCSRLHNNSVQLLLFTRWHEDDLAGRLLAREPDEWEVVAIPALKEETKPLPQAIDINDPRNIDESLWEEKHSAERIKKIREFSPITFNSLYQQRPSAQEGNMLKRDWFEVIESFNEIKYRFEIYIDGAYTEKTSNDPTAIMLIAYNNNEIIIINSTTVRMELFELLEYIPKYCEIHGFNKSRSKVWIEPKASGKSLKSMLQKSGYNCIEIRNKTVALGKYSRVEDSAPSIQGGKVKIMKGAWNNNFFDEVVAFPNGKHDDQVDNMCYSIFEHFISAPKIKLKQIN